MNETVAPETSVVIRAFNEERWLPEVLASVARQSYRDYEIILVDSGSVDRTREIATASGASVVRLRSENFTFGHSLNVGIEVARGSFIAILSAHAIPVDEHWLERLIAPLRLENTAMVFGGQRGHALSKFSEARDFERIFGDVPKRLKPPEYFANNANSAVRRDLWNDHPFDEGLPGLEDVGWARHWMDEGMAVEYEPSACIIHVHTESWAQVRRRFHREGMAARWVGLRFLRHIPREVTRELKWLGQDLWLATRRGKFALFPEIVRFRYEKAFGTVQGIVDSRGFTNPARKAELYFKTNYPAVVVRGPRRSTLEERTVRSLKPGELLIRVGFVGICGTDIEIRDGTLGYYKSGMAKYPVVPGHEFSGTVAAVGPRVTDFQEGDRVVVECIQGCGECQACHEDDAIRCHERREVGVLGLDGAYAEFVIARARYAHVIPEDVTLQQAAVAEPLAVVMKALRRLGSVSSTADARRCAVIGAGTIGHLAASVLAARGHRVTVFDQDPSRLSLLGSAATTSTSLTGLDRFDWLIEATGDQDALKALLERSSPGATLLLLGFPYARDSFNFESVVAFDRTIVGSVGSGSRDFEEALRTLPSLHLEPFLKAAFPLRAWERAWQTVEARKELKVMLNPE